MNKFEYTTIGAFHVNHNEDAKTVCEISDNRRLIAVMDGCSMGIESHFASTIIAKVLRKIAKGFHFKSFVEKTEPPLFDQLAVILKQLFQELKVLQNQLLLGKYELLSSLILCVIDEKNEAAEVITIGDGLICVNHQLTEYDQNDKPDYLGYHLNKDFDAWFQEQTQVLHLNNIKDLSIATDGIFTFKPFEVNDFKAISPEEIIHYLLINRQWEEQKNMLTRKLHVLQNEYGLKPSDDLTIIRILLG